MPTHACAPSILLLLSCLGLAAHGSDFAGDEDFDANWRAGRWTFTNGPEFPGARGSFERSAEAAHQGQFGGRIGFDFSGGGNYVGAVLRLENAPNLSAVRLWVKKPQGNELTLRYTDPTGQTLQKGFWAPDDRWVDVLVPFAEWSGHWGGANDGQIHGPPTAIGLLVEQGGQVRGSLLVDNVRFLPGTPGKDGPTVVCEYEAARFTADEQWRLSARGNAGRSSSRGSTLDFDFSQGAESIGLSPRDFSLLGNPRQIRLRVRGAAPGHPVRLQIATHFMTFEKVIGEFTGNQTRDGETFSEIVVPAPPGEGWYFYGGENDGQRHGTLRIRGVLLDANGRKDAGSLQFEPIRVEATCPPQRCCVLTAECRDTDSGGTFTATARSMAAEPLAATLRHKFRDWSGTVLAEGATELTLPPGGRIVETSVSRPAGEHLFVEAEFVLEASGQLVPAAQAYYVAPLTAEADERLNPASPFGMGLYLYRYGNDPASLATMDRAAALGAQAGVKWSREEFNWARIERTKGQYDWAFYDNMVATAKRHGISVYGELGYWSSWTKPYTAEGIEDYCRFAAAAAEHYRQDIQYWEVYNEPNIFFWQGPRDMYAELLKKAYAAIKRANPEAQVLGCSTAGIDVAFIRRTIELGAPFDVLTIHPYRSRLDDRQFVADLKHVADVVRRDDGTLRPVWITEMGWGTHTPHNGPAEGFRVTTPRAQACLIARSYIDAWASGVVPNISWYDFRNDGDNPFNFEHNMGIVTREFRPKPALRACATLAAVLAGLRPDQPLALGDNIVAYHFVDGHGRRSVIALWSTTKAKDVQLPAEGAAVRVDLMGARTPLTPVDGQLRITAEAETPVLIVVE